jgi:copper chaperone CopZ
MKNLILLLFISAAALLSAQSKKITIELEVSGNCGYCKERIEKAVDLKSVGHAEWNSDTKKMIITYSADKIELETIKEAILAIGHDVEGKLASDEIYQALPACCQYRGTAKKCEDDY